MRRLSAIVLVLVMALMLVQVGAVGAKAPGTGDRTGELSLWPNAGFGQAGDFADLAWWGTVTFGEESEEDVYGIAFFLTPGKPHPGKKAPVVTHWTEDFVIYAGTDFELDSGAITAVPETELLTAHDSGMTHWKKFTWLGNGRVLDVDPEGPFAEWDGARTHIRGTFGSVFADPPEPATGILRFS